MAEERRRNGWRNWLRRRLYFLGSNWPLVVAAWTTGIVVVAVLFLRSEVNAARDEKLCYALEAIIEDIAERAEEPQARARYESYARSLACERIRPPFEVETDEGGGDE